MGLYYRRIPKQIAVTPIGMCSHVKDILNKIKKRNTRFTLFSQNEFAENLMGFDENDCGFWEHPGKIEEI